MTEQRLYTTKELAEVLRYNEETIRRWVKSGKITPEFSSDKGMRFDLDKVKQQLNR